MKVLKDLFEELIRFALENGASYADLRFEKASRSLIVAKMNEIENVRETIVNGVGIRVLVNGSWGFASANTIEKDTLYSAVKQALAMAKGASKIKRKSVSLAPVEPVKDTVKAEVDVNPANVDPSDKISYLLELNNLILSSDERVKHVRSYYSDLTVKQIFINSEGSDIEQEKIYVYSYVDALGLENGTRVSSRESIGSTKGYGIIKENPPEKITGVIINRIKNQLRAKPVKAGKFPIVLGPEVIGLFTHEAFGHLSEADLVVSGAVTAQKIGQKVASEIVNIIDDGTLRGAFGTFRYDDEGVPTRKTTVVKNGVLVSFLYDREHAQTIREMLEKMNPDLLDMFNTEPTGNARAENYRVPPLIRMRNTYIQPGEHNIEELFEDIKFGYYLVSPLGGQANLDGTFQGGIQEAYEIIDGEVGDPVKNVSFSGNTLETLMKIDAIAKDFDIKSGTCGKFQSAYVGIGGPHVRVKELIMGGGA